MGAPDEQVVSSRQRPTDRNRNKIMVSRVGLTFSTDLGYDDWVRAGVQVSRIIDSTAWCLGDWLVCGQDKYANRYRHAIEEAGLDYQTLRNYAWVARHFPLSRRRESLSFQHHAEVAALPPDEQNYWLDRAEKAGWSRNRLRQYVRAGDAAETVARQRTSALPRMRVPVERVERWRAAAARSASGFEHWVVAALDQAAELALDRENQDREASRQP